MGGIIDGVLAFLPVFFIFSAFLAVVIILQKKNLKAHRKQYQEYLDSMAEKTEAGNKMIENQVEVLKRIADALEKK